MAIVVRPAAGGIRRHVSQLVHGLDRSRFDLTLIAPTGFVLESPPEDAAQVLTSPPLVRRCDVEIGAATRPFADLRAARALAAALPPGCKLIHAHGLRAAVVGALASRKSGVPLLVTAHNLVDRSSMLVRLCVGLIGRAASGIIAVSEAVSDSLHACGVSGSKIQVIPNGIDADWIARYLPEPDATLRGTFGIPENGPIVAAIGRLSPEKGFDLLIRAMARIGAVRPGACLVIAGEGPEAQTLRELAASVKSPAYFAGAVQDIRPLLHEAEIVAIPSRSEGQGIVALEAMAASKPVVATRVGGLAKSIVPDATGLLTEPDDADDLARAVTKLLDDEALRARMGRAGRKRVVESYRLERMVASIEAAYIRLTA